MKFFRTLVAARTAIFRVFPMMRHADVPLALKLATAALALLILSPINILGDIPFLGMFDDAALLTMLCMWFVGRAGRSLEAQPVRVGSSLAAR